jgi:hypothetical protein
MLEFKSGNPQEKIGTPVFYREVEIGTIIDFDTKQNKVQIYLSETGKNLMTQISFNIENGTLTLPIN